MEIRPNLHFCKSPLTSFLSDRDAASRGSGLFFRQHEPERIDRLGGCDDLGDAVALNRLDEVGQFNRIAIARGDLGSEGLGRWLFD